LTGLSLFVCGPWGFFVFESTILTHDFRTLKKREKQLIVNQRAIGQKLANIKNDSLLVTMSLTFYKSSGSGDDVFLLI
jgi:hypothetical protein